MPVSVTVSVDIARSRADVFRYITTIERDTDWTGGLVEARLLTDGPLAAGSRIERVSKFLGRRMTYTIEVQGVRDGELVEMITTAGPFPMTVFYELSDTPDGRTRMQIRTTGEPKGFYKLTGGLLTGAVKRQIQNDLDTLRDLLESDADRG